MIQLNSAKLGQHYARHLRKDNLRVSSRHMLEQLKGLKSNTYAIGLKFSSREVAVRSYFVPTGVS